MHDRATQALVKLALEPEWEAKFEPNSFGFRPGRSSQDAVQQIWETIKIQPRYGLDADIASCFARINQAAPGKRYTSPHFARPRKAWLKAGVVDRGTFRPTEDGTPQGGVATSYKVANILVEFSTSIPRTQLRPGYGTGFWGHRSRQDSALRGQGHNSEEAVVARRARIPTLEIRITFEPSRVSPDWVVQAMNRWCPSGAAPPPSMLIPDR